MGSVWCCRVCFGMDEFALVWLSLCLVRCGLFLSDLEDDLNENANVDTWMEDDLDEKDKFNLK